MRVSDLIDLKTLISFRMTRKRMTQISWMTWGWVNYQQKLFFLKWTTPSMQCNTMMI